MLLKSLILLFFLHSVKGTQGPKYVVEVFFALDPQILRNYINLGYSNETAAQTVKQHIEFGVEEMNGYYKTLQQYGIDIELRSIYIHQLTQELVSSKFGFVSKGVLSGRVGLAMFNRWLLDKNISQQYDFDAAILYTGYKIKSYSAGEGMIDINGLARLDAACSKNAVGLVRFVASRDTVFTTAHEIGHILGMLHDDPKVCSGVLLPVSKKEWNFSNCSAADLRKYIDHLDKTDNNCLNETNTVTGPSTFNRTRLVGSDYLDVDKYCQRVLNSTTVIFSASPMAYGNKLPIGDVLCEKIFCYDPVRRWMMRFDPPNGLICDKGKRCNKGKCEPAPLSMPAPTTDCLLVDSTERIYGLSFFKTCANFLHQTRDTCEDDNIRYQCCNACQAILSSNSTQLCPSGDNSSWCDQYQFNTAAICNDPQHRQTCCHTCRFYFPNSNTPKSFTFSNQRRVAAPIPHILPNQVKVVEEKKQHGNKSEAIDYIEAKDFERILKSLDG